jgi:hypothetical protein
LKKLILPVFPSRRYPEDGLLRGKKTYCELFLPSERFFLKLCRI